MALISPEFLQTQKYSALRDRLAFQHGGSIQPGAWDATDFKVIQRAAGASMAVDINAGFAVVGASSGGNFGYYHVQNDASITNVAVTASHATLPRIDSVYLTVNDSTNGGDANDIPAITVLAGTATSGATLDNRTGAPTPPTDALLLADLLIPAASTSVVTANIRDRRPWARGAFRRIAYTAGNIVYSMPASNPSGPGLMNLAAGLQPRLELSGVPLRMTLIGYWSATPSSGVTVDSLMGIDGVPQDSQGSSGQAYSAVTNGVNAPISYPPSFSTVPSPGTHLVGPMWNPRNSNGTAQTITMFANATAPLTMVIEELVRQNADNI